MKGFLGTWQNVELAAGFFSQTLSLFIKKYLRVSIPIQVDQSDRRRDEGSVVSHEHNAQECQFAGERIKLFQYLVQKRNIHEYRVDLKKRQIQVVPKKCVFRNFQHV